MKLVSNVSQRSFRKTDYNNYERELLTTICKHKYMYTEVLTNQVTGEIIHGLHNVLLPNIVRQSITTLDYLRQHLSLIKIDVIRHNTSIVTCCCTSTGQVRNREQRCYNNT